MLKIKTQQIIKENNFPIEVEHGSLDSLNGFNGDAVETVIDVAEELKSKNLYIFKSSLFYNSCDFIKSIISFSSLALSKTLKNSSFSNNSTNIDITRK